MRSNSIRYLLRICISSISFKFPSNQDFKSWDHQIHKTRCHARLPCLPLRASLPRWERWGYLVLHYECRHYDVLIISCVVEAKCKARREVRLPCFSFALYWPLHASSTHTHKWHCHHFTYWLGMSAAWSQNKRLLKFILTIASITLKGMRLSIYFIGRKLWAAIIITLFYHYYRATGLPEWSYFILWYYWDHWYVALPSFYADTL